MKIKRALAGIFLTGAISGIALGATAGSASAASNQFSGTHSGKTASASNHFSTTNPEKAPPTWGHVYFIRKFYANSPQQAWDACSSEAAHLSGSRTAGDDHDLRAGYSGNGSYYYCMQNKGNSASL